MGGRHASTCFASLLACTAQCTPRSRCSLFVCTEANLLAGAVTLGLPPLASQLSLSGSSSTEKGGLAATRHGLRRGSKSCGRRSGRFVADRFFSKIPGMPAGPFDITRRTYAQSEKTVALGTTSHRTASRRDVDRRALLPSFLRSLSKR